MNRETPSALFLSTIADKVRALAKGTLQDRASREDLFQDMLAAAWAALPNEADSQVGIELALAAAEEVRRIQEGRARAERRRRLVPVDETSVVTSTDPEDDIIRREGAEALISQCSEMERELLLLSFSGLSLVEIHRATGVPRSTVQQRLERASWILARARAHEPRAATG